MRTKNSIIKIGLYGCNMYRTRDLLNGLQSVAAGRFKVTACLDIDRSKAEFAAKTYGGTPFDSEDDFLSQDFDVAIISLPACLHAGAFARTSRAGKDMYLEKPVCVNADGRQMIVDAAARYPVWCYVGLSYRFIAPFQKAAEILRRPESGPIIGMHHHWLAPGITADQTPESNWRNRLEHSGGQLIHHCCHVLDWMRWIGGEITAVTASTFTPPDVPLPHEERELTACLEFAKGGMAVFNLSQQSHQYVQTGMVHAQNVALNYQWGINTFVKEYRQRPRAADVTHEWSLSPAPNDGSDSERTAQQMADFFETYTSGKSPTCTLADGIAAYDIATAIRKSYTTGRKVLISEMSVPLKQ